MQLGFEELAGNREECELEEDHGLAQPGHGKCHVRVEKSRLMTGVQVLAVGVEELAGKRKEWVGGGS